MASFNRVILAGNLTRDPQLKYLPSNTAVCEFGLAINHRWRDKDGNQREDVCFVDVAAFGRQGEVINQYMAKGRQILIEGRLKLDQWTAQDGSKRSKHSIVVENFTFLGQGPGQGGGREGGEGDAGGQDYGQPQQRGGYSGGGGGYNQSRGGAPRSAPPQRSAPQQNRGEYARGPATEPPQEDGPPGYADEGDRPPGGDDIPF